LTTEWTEVAEIVRVLRKRWDRGLYLVDYAKGEPWAPMTLPVRGPTAAEFLARFDASRSWAEKFELDARGDNGIARFRTEYRTVKGRSLGSNQLPARVWLESLEQLCALIGTTDKLRAFEKGLELTRKILPSAVPWVALHPLEVIEYRDVWDRVLATVTWVASHETSRLYLRQLDVEGVDTKFVERHKRVLDQLLSAVLPPDRVDAQAPLGDFVRRFRFRPKAYYVRFRFPCPQPAFPASVSEVRLRAEEVPIAGILAKTVFIIENEVSYLAFPEVPKSVVMFGSGYALEAANAQTWLAPKELVYWGDIDTHGFGILNNLRAQLPRVESILMDKTTLLAHPQQWVIEPIPTSRPLGNLTEAESSLYVDLVECRYGRNIRLEQERVRFSLLHSALEPWTGGSDRSTAVRCAPLGVDPSTLP
jgi:hypothetical protein